MVALTKLYTILIMDVMVMSPHILCQAGLKCVRCCQVAGKYTRHYKKAQLKSCCTCRNVLLCHVHSQSGMKSQVHPGLKSYHIMKIPEIHPAPEIVWILQLKGFLKGCGMGWWLVLVSPCFRENVVATWKIGSFLYSLDNLLQKNVTVFFFGNQISKWCSFEKGAIFDLLFTFFSQWEKLQRFLHHISHAHTYIHIFCSPYWLFLL